MCIFCLSLGFAGAGDLHSSHASVLPCLHPPPGQGDQLPRQILHQAIVSHLLFQWADGILLLSA